MTRRQVEMLIALVAMATTAAFGGAIGWRHVGIIGVPFGAFVGTTTLAVTVGIAMALMDEWRWRGGK